MSLAYHLNRALQLLGVQLVKTSTMRELYRDKAAGAKAAFDLAFVAAMPEDRRNAVIGLLDKSKAQLRQDLFALCALDFKRGGYFVEFGATNGVDLSNTHLLEKEFGWTGVLAEPARCWHESLRANRSCRIDTRCVWTRSGETLTFNETASAELSTLLEFSENDLHAPGRRGGSRYSVETVSLTDLLDQSGAPREIDFLSIDTEGSELDILGAFDFSRYAVKAIACEHNLSDSRGKILRLLESKGYERVYADISWFDDWYVLREPR